MCLGSGLAVVLGDRVVQVAVQLFVTLFNLKQCTYYWGFLGSMVGSGWVSMLEVLARIASCTCTMTS